MDKQNVITINLDCYRTKGSKVFTGRDRGISIRTKSKIDEYIKAGKTIEIIIPEMIMSINPSFLEEFLFDAVKLLGKEEFYNRVKFENKNKRYLFDTDLKEAVDRILRRSSALSKE